MLPFAIVARGLLTRPRAAALGRRQRDAGATRLRQSDRNCLLGRPHTVFAFAHVMDFFAHELSRLRARRFALTSVSTRACGGLFLRLCPSLQSFRCWFE